MPDNPHDAESSTEAKKRTVAESFERLTTAVENYDDGLVKAWRDDIDTLLFFAGLFSAVVTAFLVESYRRLEPDPADKTVALLEQLVSFQRNASDIIQTNTPFEPDASIVRVNCFWLLSLIFSLTSALFGLLCKQWVREYDREPFTSSSGQALALRQLRRDSFEKWGVPAFLAALPILLEVALLLFFAGLLDLLRRLHPIPFIVSFVAIALSTGLYIITTLLPTLTIPTDLTEDIKYRRFNRLSYQLVCPYKSPQAWAVYCLATSRNICLRILVKIFAPCLRVRTHQPCSDWSSLDLRVVKQYDTHVKDHFIETFNLQLYELRAFGWAVTTFRDNPLMVPHLQNVLGTVPPSVAMSAVLGDLNLALWTDVSSMDVNSVITDPENRERQNLKLSIRGLPHLPNIPDPVMEPQGIKLLFAHQCLMAEKIHNNFDDRLGGMGLETKDCHLAIPFSVMGRLWTHQDPNVREQGVALLQQCKKSWEKSSSNVPERVAFVTLLAKHINDTNRTSVLVEKEQAHGFVKFIHNEIITGTLYIWDIGPEWLKATRKVLQGGNLSSDYFAPLPKRRDPLRPHRLPPSSMPRFREPEANTMDIRTIDDAPVDGVGPSSSSATGRGHTASPEPHAFTLPADAQEHEDGLGSGTDSDDPRYLDSTQRGEDMGSPSHSISPERFCNKSPLVQDTHFSAGIGAAHFGVPENSVTASGSEGPCLDGTTGTPAPSLEPLGHLQVLGPVIVAANTTQDQVSHADPALIRAPERAHTREPPGHSGETFGQSSVQPPILRTNDTTANPRDVA